MSATESASSPFAGLNTPAFLVDRKAVSRNCKRMREKAERSNVLFRPHVKTHKTLEIGWMQHGGAFGPITVSTLAEAEFFAAGGFTDITYAVPIAPEKLERAAAFAAKIERLNVLIDSRRALDAMEDFHRARGVVFDVYLKIDCGNHRAGVDPNDPESVRLAMAIAHSPASRFRGLLAHAGHSYHARTPEEIRTIAVEETSSVTNFRTKLEGVDGLVRSIGSTPTTAVVDRFTGCDEVRPGNYVFFDAFQATIGSCHAGDVAVSVLASVIGSYPDRGTLLIDAGALALSKDTGPDHVDPQFGYGVVCDANLKPMPLKLTALSQEHGKIAGAPEVIARIPVGSHLRVVPNHSCLTAAMYEVFHVVEGARIVDEWMPVRGW